jgi:hypothetical protein
MVSKDIEEKEGQPKSIAFGFFLVSRLPDGRSIAALTGVRSRAPFTQTYTGSDGYHLL